MIQKSNRLSKWVSLFNFRQIISPAPSSPSSTATPSKSCTITTLNASPHRDRLPGEGPGLQPESQARRLGPHLRKGRHHPDARLRQVHTHPWRRDPAGWPEPQSGTRQAGPVLVVSEVCAWGYGARGVGEGRPRGAERTGPDPHPVPLWEWRKLGRARR